LQNPKGPTILIDEIAESINSVGCMNETYNQTKDIILKHKSIVPIKQIFALYTINKNSFLSNN
jgi:hypothetical protein